MTDSQNNGTVERIDPVDSFKEAAPILRQPFTADAVRFKVQTAFPKEDPRRALIVAYIDARLVVERLNLVCPHLWHDEYEKVADGMLCSLTVGGITRRDIGSGYQGKGLYSDALKRAAVKFGVGVSLYSVPSIVLDKGRDLTETTAGGKKTLKLEAGGQVTCRTKYRAWLDAVGTNIFGEPLDHGDTPDSVGDLEAETPLTDDREPTADQRKQVVKLFNTLGIDEGTQEMKYRAHGIERGVPATREQVNGLIVDLMAEVEKAGG